jgi:formate hydrogenlyase subunit 3/multisubunit Na+/H+ antiporter MnhD subunit
MDGDSFSFFGGQYLGVTLSSPIMLDGVGVALSLVFTIVAILVLFYSFHFVDKEEHKADYYFFFLLIVGAVVGLTFSSNGLLVYVFWEIATIAMWRLVGFYRGAKDVSVAGKAFLLNFFGASLLVLGLVIIYMQTGTFNILNLGNRSIGNLPLLLIFAGIIAKSATLPLHVWVPSAYPSAPPPVNAILSGVVEKMGIILFLRLWVQALGVPAPWNIAVPALGIISAGVAGGAALIEKDLRKILAYSTVSQLGFIFLGMGISTVLGITGVLLYIVAHSFAKAGLFLAAGCIERGTGKRSLEDLGGLMRSSPALGVSFLFLCLSIMGIPPLVGFFSKLMIVTNLCVINPWIGFASIIVAIFTMLYLFRLWHGVFLGPSDYEISLSTSRSLLGVVIVFAVISLALGILVSYPLKVITLALSGLVRIG